MLNLIELMFKAFVNPATGRFTWVGLNECKVAYLNDFSWSTEITAWSSFLLLLEGQTVHLPRQKNQYAPEMYMQCENTILFFATRKKPIEFVEKYNIHDKRESAMMSSRWLTFNFTYQIENEKNIDPCTCCFSKLALMGAEEDGDI